MRFAPILVLMVACSVVPTDLPSTTTPASTPSTGDLGDVEVRTIEVDGEPLLVAVAATFEDRSRGLRAVEDLGDLDGMLFEWGGAEVSTRFTMADTLIELDIAFFDVQGAFVDGFRMTPCAGTTCPSYAAAAPYAFALETPAGTGPAIGPGSHLDPGE